MFESYENAAQVAILLACTAVALARAIRYKSRAWTLLSFFYGVWLLGDTYWQLCLIFYDRSPQIPVVSDLSWYAGYLFLYMLLRQTAPPEAGVHKTRLAWLGGVFTFGMAAYYMQYGQIISNIIYASLMGLLIFTIIRRVTDREAYRNQQYLCLAAIVFVLCEYGMWTASCIFTEDGLRNPYYWFDILMTVNFPFFLIAVKKAVRK